MKQPEHRKIEKVKMITKQPKHRQGVPSYVKAKVAKNGKAKVVDGKKYTG